MPWISGDWSALFPELKGDAIAFALNFTGPAKMVKAIHAEHRIVRFWGSDDNELMWQYLWQTGVDLINTDHIAALRKWELAQKR